MSTLSGPNVVGSFDASAFIARSEIGAARGLAKATQRFIRELKINLSIPGPTKTHPEAKPSRPGEPPHRRTGALRASEKGFPVDEKRLTWRAGSNIEYARALELGFPPHLAARPVLVPTLNQVEPDLVRDVQQAVAAEIG